MAKPTESEIVERFASHARVGVTSEQMLVAHYMNLAVTLIHILPEGRKLSVALTELETSLLWALSATR